MGDISQVINVNITVETSSVSVQEFGTALNAGYHTHWTDRYREYDMATVLSDMVSEGFSTSEPLYKMAQAHTAANPRSSKIQIGRCDNSWQQLTQITPTVIANATVYSGSVNGVAWTFTSSGSATLANVCTGVASAITALALVTASGASGTHVTVTTDASNTIADINGTSSNLMVEDVTVDSGMAADLAAIRIASPSFFGLCIDTPSDAAKIVAAAFAESNNVLFGCNLNGTRALDSTDTTDTASTMHGTGYLRSYGIYHSAQTSRPAERWMGGMFALDPSFGKTWNLKSLSGVTVENLTANQIASLKGKAVNYYTTFLGDARTQSGYTFAGVTRFIDQTTLSDELKARIQEAELAAVERDLPYSNASADILCAEIRGILNTHIQRGSIAASPAPTCTHPDVSTVSDNDRANRNFPDITFTAQTAGRIHTVKDIVGKLTV